jgi:hypothetical protein
MVNLGVTGGKCAETSDPFVIHNLSKNDGRNS